MRNSKFFKLLLVLSFISTFSSCTNESIINSEKTITENNSTSRMMNPNTGPISSIKQILYAVYTNMPSVAPFNPTAKLRIQGTTTSLSTSNNSGALSVSVSNTSDVYVGGFENNSSSPWDESGAKVWKNGTNYFSLPVGSPAVTSIVTDNNDVYFVTGKDIYKNNALLYALSTAGTPYAGYSCSAESIYVYNSDVYATGITSCKAVVVWKNGVVINVFPQTSTDAGLLRGRSIYVDSTDVYVAGFIDGQAKVWKNSVQINLPSIVGNYSHADGITGDGTNVYIAGGVGGGSSDGRLWKMNKLTNLVSILGTYNGGRTCVFYSNQGNIYTGGWEKIWRDSSFIYNDSQIFYNSIFVVN